MNIAGYLDEVRSKYASGQATEHSYRPALQKLFESISHDLTVINEPKRSDAGMPDFLFQRGDVPVGWCEAKDVDKDVIKLKGYSIEQRKRYEKAYPNLIYTNGVDFEFIREGERVHFVTIADFLMGLQPNPDKFDELARQLKQFAEQKPISIRSAAKLAEIMAAKAAIIKDEIGIALADDKEFRSGLGGQFKSFKANLLPALTPDEFADIYAETITYGMFAARFHDDTLDTFSRQEALEKLPASNPFLKGLFEYIAGPQLPKRLTYIVDDLVQVMRASDPHSLFEKYGKFTARNDPFVHFYEDFLAAYNPKKRKSRGVWYTPEPVVDFIVRAVDDVLKTEFGLADGLADTSKVTVDWDTGQNDAKGKPVTIKKDVHKVQILDPATGTGTFLAKAVQLISDRVKARAPGKWSGYVEQDLLPRLHGFELLMASYAMCHMKLDMQLAQTGYKPSANPPRLSVWLTNSLEPAEREVRDLFFQPLADEARGASEVKRQSPIMCVIGNPPYSISSQNRGEWITGLLKDYKRGLGERKVNLDDDYIKFIRMCQYLIEKNGCGVVGLITNNSFLDGITHRKMREELMSAFDRIYVCDLHGSAVRQERTEDGRTDENVFDIMQGVAITILVKRQGTDNSIRHRDLFGKRGEKYAQLWTLSIRDKSFVELKPQNPSFFFKEKDFSATDRYEKFVPLPAIFEEQNSGIKSDRDSLFIDLSSVALGNRVSRLLSGDYGFEFVEKYNVRDSGSYSITSKLAGRTFSADNVKRYHYRPFDFHFIYYDPRVISRPAEKTSRHLMVGPNIFLIAPRQAQKGFRHAFITDVLPDVNLLASAGMFGCGYSFPLYLYPDELADQSEAFAPKHRTLNLNPKLYAAICTAAGIDPTNQAGPDDDFRAVTGEARPSEVRVFDYIYGVLHSPAYRETFAEFLKIDFPRIPYPASPEVFAHVSDKGEQLRRLHLMEAPAIGDTPFPYEGEGDDVVASGYPKFEDGTVQINKDQHFEGVPDIAWGFHIGGYQPAQKWLKDRRGRPLSWDDISHYQKIVKILAETDRIMKEIELPLA